MSRMFIPPSGTEAGIESVERQMCDCVVSFVIAICRFSLSNGKRVPAVRGGGTKGRCLCMAEPCRATRKYRVMSCNRHDTLHKEHEHIWVIPAKTVVVVKRNEVRLDSSIYHVRGALFIVYFLLADSPCCACSHISSTSARHIKGV